MRLIGPGEYDMRNASTIRNITLAKDLPSATSTSDTITTNITVDFLIEHKVKVVGTDTLGIEPYSHSDFKVHKAISDQTIPRIVSPEPLYREGK